MSCAETRPQLIRDGVLKAVHDDDLEGFLRSLGEWDGFINGDKKCRWCDVVITRDNLYSIYPVLMEITYCCHEPSCVTMLTRWCAGHKEERS